MEKETKEPKAVGGLEQEQWKIETDNYKRTFTLFQAAKRNYGQWCKLISKEQSGEVEMYYRPNAKTEWTCIEEFSMGIDDDDDDDDDNE